MSPLASVDITNVNEKVYIYLRRNIIRSNFPAGSKLNVKKLSAELGVSSTPIKDALFRLSGEGLVDITSRSGTYVRNITEGDIHEILQVRMFLEKAVVETIAETITKDQLRTLSSIYEKSISIKVDPNNAETYQNYMEYDNKFHRSFFEFVGNAFLLKIYKNLNAHIQTVRFLMLNQAQGKLPTTDRDHKKILDALYKKNAERAKKAVEDHIRNADNAWAQIGKRMKTERFKSLIETS